MFRNQIQMRFDEMEIKFENQKKRGRKLKSEGDFSKRAENGWMAPP